jgi:hypothetical protein
MNTQLVRSRVTCTKQTYRQTLSNRIIEDGAESLKHDQPPLSCSSAEHSSVKPFISHYMTLSVFVMQ